MDARATNGEIYNVGSTESIAIRDLARRVLDLTASSSQTSFVPYEQVYGQGIEDMLHRRPSIEKIRAAIGWAPERGLEAILDDVIAYAIEPTRYLVVVNAANREADFRWLKERELPGSDVRDVSDTYALLAVQGPRAIERLGLPEARPFTFAEGAIDGIEMMVNRTGYTGEPGCELLVMRDDAGALWDRVLERGAVPCGLGARDTLRLEVCYPLHGNDITPDTDAISAGLGWTCALEKEFTGAQRLREIRERGPEQKLVPFVMVDRAIPRQGMPIEGGGVVTSGTHSPMLDVGIGMAYVPAESAQPDSELTIDVRGRPRCARIVKRPIYKREEA
jgi:aminomethyltransferase